MEQRDFVVLVDKNGYNLVDRNGSSCTMEKLEAHHLGSLHRAISVFIFNDRNELLLQKRAVDKYHSPEKWTNTCCTHPSPGETPIITAQRRLVEEMGLVARLTEAFTFSYRADVGNSLVENEFDHVFFGTSNGDPKPDPVEVADWDWVTLEKLNRALIRNPEEYTPWLRQCFDKVLMYKLQATI